MSRAMLEPLEVAFAGRVGAADSCWRRSAMRRTALAGDALWAGPAGRAAAELLEALEACRADRPVRTRAGRRCAVAARV